MLEQVQRHRYYYENALRVVGYYLDRLETSNLFLAETPEGFVLKITAAMPTAASNRIPTSRHTFILTNRQLFEMVELAPERRRLLESNGWLSRWRTRRSRSS